MPDEYMKRMAAQERHGAEGEDAWKPGDQKPERRDRTHKIHNADRSQSAGVDEEFRERRYAGYEPVMVCPEKTTGKQADGKVHSPESPDRRQSAMLPEATDCEAEDEWQEPRAGIEVASIERQVGPDALRCHKERVPQAALPDCPEDSCHQPCEPCPAGGEPAKEQGHRGQIVHIERQDVEERRPGEKDGREEEHSKRLSDKLREIGIAFEDRAAVVSVENHAQAGDDDGDQVPEPDGPHPLPDEGRAWRGTRRKPRWKTSEQTSPDRK